MFFAVYSVGDDEGNHPAREMRITSGANSLELVMLDMLGRQRYEDHIQVHHYLEVKADSTIVKHRTAQVVVTSDPTDVIEADDGI